MQFLTAVFRTFNETVFLYFRKSGCKLPLHRNCNVNCSFIVTLLITVPFPVVRAAYIDNEMKKLKGESSQDESEKKSKFKAAEDALYQLPEHLQASERVITAPKR